MADIKYCRRKHIYKSTKETNEKEGEIQMKKALCTLCVLLIAISCIYVAPVNAKAANNESSYSTKLSDDPKGKVRVVGVGEFLTLMKNKPLKERKGYRWISSNPRVVSVNQHHRVRGEKKGTAIIYYAKFVPLKKGTLPANATLKDYNIAHARFRFKVQVMAAPKAVILNKAKVSCFPGVKTTLTAKVNSKAHANKFKFKTSSRRVAKVNENGVITAVSAGKATITVSVYNKVKATCKVSVKDKNKICALTFDDGPSAYTADLLKSLKAYDCTATFFTVGCYVNIYPDTVRQMVKDGMEIGTHTYDHPFMTRLGRDGQLDNLNRSITALKNACGKYPTVYRPPYGGYNADSLSVAKDLKLPVIMWNTDVEDWKTSNVQTVVNNILRNAKNGTVYVIHDSHKSSVQAITTAIPILKKQGYEFVSISEYADLFGVKLEPGVVFHGK